MKYILKYYLYSKYYGFKRVNYVEFFNKENVIDLINKLELSRDDYEIYIKII